MDLSNIHMFLSQSDFDYLIDVGAITSVKQLENSTSRIGNFLDTFMLFSTDDDKFVLGNNVQVDIFNVDADIFKKMESAGLTTNNLNGTSSFVDCENGVLLHGYYKYFSLYTKLI